MSISELKEINVVANRSKMVTPTALLTALYAEYDGLLDSLELVQSQMKSQGCSEERMHIELRRKAHEICEALADVHEKIADFDFVIMRGSE
jgi:hypothetical protein